MIDRRDFLRASAGATLLVAAKGCRPDRPRWDRAAFARPERSPVAILDAASYDASLVDVIARGIQLCRLDVQDRRVVLKPNFVEFDPAGAINTHPAVVAAAIEAFRTLGAREVIVAEGPGHRRDNEYLLTASGLLEVLREHRTRYVDLNTDRVRAVPLRSRFTEFGRLHLPETVLDADLLVSMPKLKTHHWAGATLSMKNMFGIIPGAVYGWPKNALHWAGITASILDINAALAVPRFNIVDGIVGMEGNGPIQGDARRSGVLVFGADPVAVDATGCRLMNLDPWKVEYLKQAEAFLGNVADERIDMIGESLDRWLQDYRVLDSFRHLKAAPLITAG